MLHKYDKTSRNGLGALIRLMAGPTGFSELISAASGIDMALESVLIQGAKSDPENVEKNHNVLKNLLTLLK